VAAPLCASSYLPVLVLLAGSGRLGGAPLGHAVAAGVLPSAVPYAVDLMALRVVPQRLFGVFMSIHPVMAVLAGMVLLGRALAGHEWLGIGVVVLANAAAVVLSRRPPGPRPPSTARRRRRRPYRPARPRLR
jgi:inner membrane transporter RhtA